MSEFHLPVMILIPYTALLAPSYLRVLLEVLRKQPDAIITILFFIVVILIATCCLISLSTLFFTAVASSIANRPYMILFSTAIPLYWVGNIITSAVGAWAIARATRKEEKKFISDGLEVLLCALMSTTITAASAHLSDMACWFGVSLAAAIRGVQNMRDTGSGRIKDGWSYVPPIFYMWTEPWQLVIALIAFVSISFILLVVLMTTVVPRAAAKHKAKEQWVEVDDGHERYRDERTSEETAREEQG